MRPAAVCLLPAHPCLLAAVPVELREARALLAPVREGPLVLGAPVLARSLELAPPAGVVVDALRSGLELDDSIHRPIEQRAVVRDEHDSALDGEQEALEQVEPGEVQVVGRLVQQEDVEPREQDRGERRAALLAAGERAGRPVERRVEADVREHSAGARFEVGSAERQEALERLGVGLSCVRVALERGLQGREPRLDLPHPGAAREIGGKRLLRREVALLREIADAQRSADCA